MSGGYLGSPQQAVRRLGWRMRPGNYHYFSPPGAATTSATLGTNLLRLAPFPVPDQITLQTLGGDVAVVGDAGSVVRLGIYASDADGSLPGALVPGTEGTILGDVAAVQEYSLGGGSGVVLPPGLYWLGGVVQLVATTQPTVRVVGSAWNPFIPLGTVAPGAGGSVAGVGQSGVSGALPATFALTQTVGTAPRVHGKVA